MTAHVLPSRVLPSGIVAVTDYPAERTPWVELGWPGLDPKTPCLDIFLFDDSGSVTSPVGSDPVGGRFREATTAIQLVADWTISSRSKITVLHFDYPAGCSGVHSLNEKHLLRRLRPSLQLPTGGIGTSDLGPSLSAAEQLTEAHPGSDVRLTVFSDFELSDPDPAAVLSRLAAFPGRVHAVVLGGSLPLDLVGLDTVTITPISPHDPPGSFAAALHHSLTSTRRARRSCVLHGTSRKELLS